LTVVSVLATATATSAFLVARPRLDTLGAIALLTIGFVAWGAAVLTARDAGSPRLVVLAIGAVLAVAVVVPPRGSHDLWGYVEYGRIVSEHDASPYERVPADFPHDPLLPRMGSGYHRTRSPYGPAFTAISAVATGATGSDPLPNRLAFQALEALAVAGALVVLWRRTRRTDALVWVGLNPVVVTAVVNDGHNDGLVMLCVLAGVVLAGGRRPWVAGLVLAAAALVKLPALLALGGLAIWMVHRRGRGDAARAVGAGLATVIAGYAVVGPDAIASIGDSGDLVSRASVWGPVNDLLVSAGHAGIADALPAVSLVAVVGVAVLFALAGRTQPDPAASTAGAASSFALAGSYVLPWYTTWGLPTFATRRPTWLAWIVAAQGALLLLAYQLPHHANERANGLLVHLTVTDVLPVVVLLAAVVVGAREVFLHRDERAHLRFARG
jgi:hypothetical protein